MSDAPPIADRFWRDAGGTTFPRDVAAAAAWSLPVLVAEVPGLMAAAVGRWLRERGVPVPELPARPLRACLVARAGGGVILRDAEDSADERRYSAAHEIGHFLRDHVSVRDRVRRSLGDAALHVLDGLRRPTADERLDAMFADVPLRPLTHLLDRDAAGGFVTAAASEAEAAADGLAIELLAPEAEAERRLPAGPVRDDRILEAAAGRFARDFGLPIRVARSYARHLLRRREADRPLRERLGFGPAENVKNRRRTSGVPAEHRSHSG